MSVAGEEDEENASLSSGVEVSQYMVRSRRGAWTDGDDTGVTFDSDASETRSAGLDKFVASLFGKLLQNEWGKFSNTQKNEAVKRSQTVLGVLRVLAAAKLQ